MGKYSRRMVRRKIISSAMNILILNVRFHRMPQIDLLEPIAQKIRNVGTRAVAKAAGNVLLHCSIAKTNYQFGPLQPSSYPCSHSLASSGRYWILRRASTKRKKKKTAKINMVKTIQKKVKKVQEAVQIQKDQDRTQKWVSKRFQKI